MPAKKHKPEVIIGKLREVEIMLGQGGTTAEAAGDSEPWRQQAILGRSRWDADALRDIVRDYPRRWPSRVRLVYRADAGRASAKRPSGRTLAAIR
jgi:SRSO17 transposase